METRNLRIAITGPESVGKSTLCLALGKKFDGIVVDEFARNFLKNTQYGREDVVYIAQQQIRLEQEAIASGASLIFCDTDLINIKIWLEYYKFEVPEFIEEYIQSKPYDYSLLLYPNTAWVADELRDKPNERLELYKLFEEKLIQYNYSYFIIDELGAMREQQAFELITELLKN